MRDFRVEPRGGATGQPEIWLKIGAKGHVKPIMTYNGPAPERTYRTGLMLRVTMRFMPSSNSRMGGASG